MSKVREDASQRTRCRRKDGQNLTRELLAYSAAGAGILGLAELANGAIVYRDLPDTLIEQSSPPFVLDLDGDGIVDFSIAHTFGVPGATTMTAGIGNALARQPLPSNCYQTFATLPAGATGCSVRFPMFAAGARIDNQLLFTPPGSATSAGLIAFPGSGYLGLRFRIVDSHFGWLRVEHREEGLAIFDAAYESQPGVGIDAGAVPEPASLGVLALGAVGLSMWRWHKR